MISYKLQRTKYLTNREEDFIYLFSASINQTIEANTILLSSDAYSRSLLLVKNLESFHKLQR